MFPMFLFLSHVTLTCLIDRHALQVQDLGVVAVQLTRLIEQHTIRVHDQDVLLYKVHWNQFGLDSATWEDAEDLQQSFPHLF